MSRNSAPTVDLDNITQESLVLILASLTSGMDNTDLEEALQLSFDDASLVADAIRRHRDLLTKDNDPDMDVQYTRKGRIVLA